MPIYNYKCKDCGNVYEVIVFKPEDEPKVCEDENCKGSLERLLSAPNFKINGLSAANGYGLWETKKNPSKNVNPVKEN